MVKYYENKKRMNGEVRICAVCKLTKLSQYNDSTICISCERSPERRRNAEAHQLMEELNVSLKGK